MALPHREGCAVIRVGSFDRLWRRLRDRVWERRRIALLQYEVTGSPPERASRVPVRFGWATPEDLECLNRPELNFNDQTVREARRWLSDGDRCLIGYVDGAPATYRWMTFSVRKLPTYHLRVGRHQAYFYKSFTVERLRGNGLNQAALCVALGYCHAAGIRRVFVDADLSNIASLRSLRNAGFKDIGTFSIVRLGRRRYTYMSRALRRRVAADAEAEGRAWPPCG